MANEAQGICYICGSPLIWDENAPNCILYDNLEDGVIKEITCKKCGGKYRFYISPDNTPEAFQYSSSCDNQGYGICINCGSPLGCSSDWMRSDLFTYDDGSDIDITDDATVRNLNCHKCGCSVEVFEPTENEMRNYPFWNK